MKICAEVFERYPDCEIGYVLAQCHIEKSNPYVEALKRECTTFLASLGVNETNFAIHPKVALWREIYERDFNVKPKSYRSSLEALIKRVLTGKSIWNICTVVDLYNVVSVLSLLPMGGYDVEKIRGDIHIRFGVQGERFFGINHKQSVEVQSNQVVYADEEKVLCWLWNHKDSIFSQIDEKSREILFFIDGEKGSVAQGIKLLEFHLQRIDASCVTSGLLNREHHVHTL